MAEKSSPFSGVRWHQLTATEDVTIGAASPDTVGTFIVQIEGTAWTGSIVFKQRISGGSTASMSWVACAYEDVSDGSTATAAITADGLFRVYVDASCELQLAYTHTSGTVDILSTRGKG